MDRPSDAGIGALFKDGRKEKPSHLDYRGGRDVILYHFTELKNVEAIKREGLRAAPQKDIEGVMSFVGGGDLPVVFLCDTPTSAVTDLELEEFRRDCPEDDIVSKRWMLAVTNEPLARFTVRLPLHDRSAARIDRTWSRRRKSTGSAAALMVS